MPIADASEAILIPSVRARPSMVVREVAPRIAARTVVFAHAAPRAFAEVRSPPLPMLCSVAGFLQAQALGCLGRFRSSFGAFQCLCQCVHEVLACRNRP